MTDSTNKKSFFQDLWDRRFFQYLATYLGVTWGLIQFSEWLVNRYGLNEGIVDRIALLLFACLPAVISLIYYHGRAGDDLWRPFEKIFYPINLILALGASFFLIDGTAQSKTREIQVSTPGSDSLITRVIPKAEYTSRIVFFPFTSSLSSEEKWMEWSVPMLADYDIEQDMQWYSIRPQSLTEEYDDYGYDIDTDIPYSAKRKIAGDLYCDFFCTADLKRNENEYEVSMTVHRTKDGKKIYQSTLESESIFGIVDQISKAVTDNINKKIIDASLSYVDLPSQDLVTANLQALEHYSKSLLKIRKNYTAAPEALVDIEKAIELDPTCAECYSLKSIILNISGKSGMETARTALENAENLPERQQLQMKYYNYLHSQESAKAEKLLYLWKDLYPQDIFPFRELITNHNRSYNFNKAKAVAKEAIEAGHNGTVLLSAANLYLKEKEIDSAELYIEKYEDLYPEKAKKKTLLGDIYAGKGDFAEAAQVYEQNTILNPGNIGAYISLAEANFYQLKLDDGMTAFKDALEASTTFRDSLQVFGGSVKVLINFGMIDEVIETVGNISAIYEKNYPPASQMTNLITKGAAYSTIRDYEKVRATIVKIKSILPDYLTVTFNPLLAYLEDMWTENKERYPESWEKAKPLVQSTAGETGLLTGDLFLHIFQEEWEKALDVGAKFLEVSGTGAIEDFGPLFIECYIKLNKKDEGLKFLNNILKTNPKHPLLLFSKFKLLMEFNDFNKARKLVSDLEKAFSEAHPDFTSKVEFEEYKEQLSS